MLLFSLPSEQSLSPLDYWGRQFLPEGRARPSLPLMGGWVRGFPPIIANS